MTSPGALARLIRLHLVPLLLAPIYSLTAARRLMFRTVSQTAVNYRESSLSEGHAGEVHGGDRLPWVKSALNGSDNFTPLTSLAWQVHVYGEANSEIRNCVMNEDCRCTSFPGVRRQAGLACGGMLFICCGLMAMWRWRIVKAERQRSRRIWTAASSHCAPD